MFRYIWFIWIVFTNINCINENKIKNKNIFIVTQCCLKDKNIFIKDDFITFFKINLLCSLFLFYIYQFFFISPFLSFHDNFLGIQKQLNDIVNYINLNFYKNTIFSWKSYRLDSITQFWRNNINETCFNFLC